MGDAASLPCVDVLLSCRLPSILCRAARGAIVPLRLFTPHRMHAQAVPAAPFTGSKRFALLPCRRAVLAVLAGSSWNRPPAQPAAQVFVSVGCALMKSGGHLDRFDWRQHRLSTPTAHSVRPTQAPSVYLSRSDQSALEYSPSALVDSSHEPVNNVFGGAYYALLTRPQPIATGPRSCAISQTLTGGY